MRIRRDLLGTPKGKARNRHFTSNPPLSGAGRPVFPGGRTYFCWRWGMLEIVGGQRHWLRRLVIFARVRAIGRTARTRPMACREREPTAGHFCCPATNPRLEFVQPCNPRVLN